MKKKTIATSLLAILVSTYATPFVSNAETISGATKDTTEQVAPTTDSEAAPTADSEAPAAKEEAPAAKEEAPAAKEEAPTTKEAPETKAGAQTRDLETLLATYKAEIQAEIYEYQNAGLLTEVQTNQLILNLSKATTEAQMTAVKKMAKQWADATQTQLDNDAVTKAKDDAYATLWQLKIDKKITDAQYTKATGLVGAAEYKFFTEGSITSEQALAQINAAVSEAQAIADAKDLKAAKTAAKNELPGLVAEGKLPSAEYYNTLQKIDAATSIAEVNAIIDAIKNGTTVTPPTTTDVDRAKESAKTALAGWLAEGLLTQTEHDNFVSEVEQSTTVDAVNAVLAEAQDLADSRRDPAVDVTLATAKQEAKDQLFTWLSYGQINDNQYVNGINAVNEATTVAEVNAAIAAIQAEIDGEVANTLAQIKQDAKDQLFEWFTNGDLTANDYAFYLSQVIAAQDAEDVAAVIANAEQQINENGLHFDLEAYKQDARDQLATWLAGGWITGDQYWAYLSLVDVATTKEQVDAALEALLAEIDNADTLENAQNNATNQLIAWLAEGKITEAQYYTYLQRIADATTVAEVKAILAELQAIIDGEDVTEKPVAKPSNPITNTNNNTNNVLVSVTTTENGGKKATVTTKEIVKTTDAKKAELPKTGETNQNLTALGLMSVALGSLVAVLKRKRS